VAPGGQPQERAQVLAPPRLLAERLLALRELPGQTEQRAGGGGLALQVPRRERGRALGQGGRQGALQPALEHPDAAQRALVQRLPGADQVRLLGQRQVPLEGEDHALEGQAIRGVVGLVASEVDLDAAPTELGTQVGEPQQLVGAHEHVHRARQRGQGLERVHLVEQAPRTRQPPQVLRLVDEADRDAPLAQALLQHPAQIRRRRAALDHRPRGPVRGGAPGRRGDLVRQERLLQRRQGARVVVFPVELAGLGSHRLQCEDREAAGVPL